MHADISRRLRDVVRRFILQGNAPAHKSDLVRDFLATAIPYSSDLTAADFYLFL